MSWRNFRSDSVGFAQAMRPHWVRFLKSFRTLFDLPHAYVNLFVEGARFDPYYTGHWAAFLTLAQIVGGIVWLLV